MPATVNSAGQRRPLSVLGETIRPLMTTAMGSSIEICDMRGRPTPARRRTATRGRKSTW
jgi:hypothetical protein